MKILLWVLPIASSLACAVSVNGSVWVQTNWEGGRGQQAWADSTMYLEGWSEDAWTRPGELRIRFPGWARTGDLNAGKYLERVVGSRDGSIYVAASNGDIFRSTNAGVTWVKRGSVPTGVEPLDMIEGPDGSFYVVYDKVYRSFDSCSTWFQTTGLPMKVKCLYSIAEAAGTIYVGGHIDNRLWHEGQVFKSTNGGLSWDTTAWPPQGCMSVRAILPGIDGALYAAGSEGGCVLRTTNKGASWALGHLEGPMFVYDLTQSPDSALYAGTGGGHVWGSGDLGTTWHEIALLPRLGQARCLLASRDGSLYAGGTCNRNMLPGRIYRSTDGGNTWVETGDAWPDSFGGVVDFVQTADGTIFAGGWGEGEARVYRLTSPKGWIISSVFDAGIEPQYGAAWWIFAAHGDPPVVKVRTDSLPDMSGAFDWDLCPVATNGQDISLLSSVHDGQRYIQYRIGMTGWDAFTTPVFREISIEYSSVGVSEHGPKQLSSDLSLELRPNPFRNDVGISFSVSESCHLQIAILDIAGRPVRRILDGPVSIGKHSIVWDGCSTSGVSVSPGIYFCSLTAAGLAQTRKLVLLR